MKYPFSLVIGNPVKSGNIAHSPLDIVRYLDEGGWRRSKRLIGGDHVGQCSIESKDLYLLRYLFDTAIGCYLTEYSYGIITWRGYIAELTFTTENGMVFRRSLNLMENRIQAEYNASGGTNVTAAAQNDMSVARFGEKQNRISGYGWELSLAERIRDLRLKEYGFPYIKVVSKTDRSPRLDIVAQGIYYTMNYKYITTDSSTKVDLSTFLSTIVGADSEFVNIGNIRTNTFQTQQMFPQSTKLWDAVEKLTELSDSSLNKYRSWVGRDGKFYYDLVSTTPIGMVIKTGITNGQTASDIVPWFVEPGIYRDTSRYLSESNWDSFYQKSGDFLADEVEVSSSGKVSLKTDQFMEESDILSEQEAWDDYKPPAEPEGKKSRGPAFRGSTYEWPDQPSKKIVKTQKGKGTTKIDRME